MERFLGRFQGLFFAILRIVAGVLWAFHGAQKLFGMFGREQPVELMSQLGVAAMIELVGGTCIAIGFFASYWAFIASGQMAVAYFQAHAPRGRWPIVNGGELAALYCWLFLYIASHGTGMLSLDALRRGGGGRRR